MILVFAQPEAANHPETKALFASMPQTYLSRALKKAKVADDQAEYFCNVTENAASSAPSLSVPPSTPAPDSNPSPSNTDAEWMCLMNSVKLNLF